MSDVITGRIRCAECRNSTVGVVGWCSKDVCAGCWEAHAKKCGACQTGEFAIKPKPTARREDRL